MLHSRREKLFLTDDRDLKCKNEMQKKSLGYKCNILFVITIFCWKRATG